MAVAFESVQASGAGATGVNLTINKPSGVVENDILLGVIHLESDAAVTPPSDWALIVNVDSPANDLDLHVFWKRATGSEPANYTWTHGNAYRSGYIARFSGCVTTGDPQDATPATAALGFVTGTIAFPSVTTATDGAMAIGVGVTYDTRTGTPPSGWDERLDSVLCYLATKPMPTAGATGAASVTLNSTSIVCSAVIALKPAPAGGSPVTVNLDAALVTSAAQTLTVTPGAASVSLDAATATVTAQAVDAQPGTIAVALDAATITASAQGADVQPGATSVALDSATLSMGAQTVLVQVSVTVALSVASLSAAGQTLDVTPGAASVALDAASLVASAPAFDVQPGAVAVTLDAAALLAGAQAATIAIGATTVSLGVASLTVTGQTLPAVGLGLVGYWSLEDLTDAYGAHDLTNHNGVTFGAGKVADAAQFAAASTQYLSVASDANLQTGDRDFYMALWVKADDLSQSRWVAGKWGGTTANSEWSILYNSSTGQVSFIWRNADGTQRNVPASSVTPVVDTWYFLEVWRNKATATIGICINRGTEHTLSGAVSGVAGTAPLEFGSISATPNFEWDGQLDEIGLWRRIPSGAERDDFYNDGDGRSYAYLSGGASPQTVTLAVSALALAGQTLDVVPGGVTATLDVAVLAASGPALAVQPGAVAVALDGAGLAISAQVLTVMPGGISISLDGAALTAAGQALTVSSLVAGRTVALEAAVLLAAGPSLGVTPGGVSVGVNAAQLVIAAVTVLVQGQATRVDWTLHDAAVHTWTLSDAATYTWTLAEAATYIWTVEDATRE